MKKTVFIAINEEYHPIIETLCKKGYEVKTTTLLSSLNHWLKEETPDLVVLQENIESHGFFLDPKLKHIAGKEFHKQRVLSKNIPTIFLDDKFNIIDQENILLAG